MVMDEETCSKLFADCERGVVPPFGELMGFPAVGGTLLEWARNLARHCAGYT